MQREKAGRRTKRQHSGAEEQDNSDGVQVRILLLPLFFICLFVFVAAKKTAEDCRRAWTRGAPRHPRQAVYPMRRPWLGMQACAEPRLHALRPLQVQLRRQGLERQPAGAGAERPPGAPAGVESPMVAR